MPLTLNVVFDVGPALVKLGELIVANAATWNAKLDGLETLIQTVKADIDALKAQLAAGGMSAAEEDQLEAKLDAKIAALQAVADSAAS